MKLKTDKGVDIELKYNEHGHFCEPCISNTCKGCEKENIKPAKSGYINWSWLDEVFTTTSTIDESSDSFFMRSFPF